MRTARVCLLAALGLVLVGLPAGSAFHTAGPGLAQAGGTGVGWASFAGSSPGTELTVDAVVEDPGQTWQIGITVQAADGTHLGGGIATSLSRDDGYRLDVDGPIEIHEEELTPAQPMDRGGLGVTISGVSGEFIVIVWTAGTAASWSAHILGDEGTEIHAQTQGEETFLYRMRDLQGPATATWTSDQARAHVLLAAKAVEQIDHHLVGVFNKGDTRGADLATATGPDGMAVCTCHWWHAFGERAMAPGSYTFEVTELGADLFIDGYLGGADIRLPG